MSHIGFDPHALRSPRESVQGTLICPGGEVYKRAWSGWNGMINGHPALIVRCAGQLPQLLRCARLHAMAWLHSVAEVGLLGGIEQIAGVRIIGSVRNLNTLNFLILNGRAL